MVKNEAIVLVRPKPYRVAKAGPSGGMKISLSAKTYASIGDLYHQYYDEDTGRIILVPVKPVRVVRGD